MGNLATFRFAGGRLTRISSGHQQTKLQTIDADDPVTLGDGPIIPVMAHRGLELLASESKLI